eukprot:scaffold1042_cov401-Prasinococcus_capsulatus_cf.AAC.16
MLFPGSRLSETAITRSRSFLGQFRASCATKSTGKVGNAAGSRDGAPASLQPPEQPYWVSQRAPYFFLGWKFTFLEGFFLAGRVERFAFLSTLMKLHTCQGVAAK